MIYRTLYSYPGQAAFLKEVKKIQKKGAKKTTKKKGKTMRTRARVKKSKNHDWMCEIMMGMSLAVFLCSFGSLMSLFV